MKKKFFLLFVIIFCGIYCIRFFSIKKFNNKIQSNNIQVQSQLESIGRESVLIYGRQLYYNISKNIQENLNKDNIVSLKYDHANFDIDLMPIIISGRLLLVQTHSIKILHDGLTYEYRCDEQIKSITYPKLENSDLVFYLIKLNSNKSIDKIPSEEREWILQKIVFADKKFIEKTIERIDIPYSYIIKQLHSEVSFFTYENDIINTVLTDSYGKSSIFQISNGGTEIQHKFNGEIIIANQIFDKNFWYIRTDEENKTWLMKDEEIIREMNQMVSQGSFLNESMIQFVYMDYSQVDKFDFINGPYIPISYSELYLIKENRIIPSYFLNYGKGIFKDKIITDNILVIF